MHAAVCLFRGAGWKWPSSGEGGPEPAIPQPGSLRDAGPVLLPRAEVLRSGSPPRCSLPILRSGARGCRSLSLPRRAARECLRAGRLPSLTQEGSPQPAAGPPSHVLAGSARAKPSFASCSAAVIASAGATRGRKFASCSGGATVAPARHRGCFSRSKSCGAWPAPSSNRLAKGWGRGRLLDLQRPGSLQARKAPRRGAGG